mgnify:CR=1 FL=1
MENEFRGKVRHIFLKVVKKNKYLKKPMLFCMTIVLMGYYALRHLADNGKRYASIGFVVIFFMLNSSFAFPVMVDRGGFMSLDVPDIKQETEASGMAEVIVTEESGAVLAKEPVMEDEIEILDDEDVMDYYEDAEHHGLEDEDQYTLDEILEENEDYQVETGDIPNQQDSSKNAFYAEDWRLVLINKQHLIPEDYTFELVTIKGCMQCDRRIKDDLLAMLQGAKDEGVNLVIRSPYRDMSRQEYLFNRKIKVYMQKGMSYLEAYKTASQTVTVPGASEHQIGLAIDITSDNYASLDAGFGDTQAGEWLAKHSCEYGFILRYPLGKESITGIEYEPWHFRYVGKEAATIIMEKGITLEEFVESYS